MSERRFVPNRLSLALLLLLVTASRGSAGEPATADQATVDARCSTDSVATLSAPLRKSMDRVSRQMRELSAVLRRLDGLSTMEADDRDAFYGAVANFSRAFRAFRVDADSFATRAAYCAAEADLTRKAVSTVDSASDALRRLHLAMTRREPTRPDVAPTVRLVQEGIDVLRSAATRLADGTTALMPESRPAAGQ